MKKLSQLMFSVLIITSITFCTSDPSHSNPPKNQDLWYVGGNLHSSTVNEWKNATDKNKLATCADFVANIKKTNGQSYNGDTNLMKKDAMELLSCIETAILDEKGSSIKISEVTVLCAMMSGK